MLSALVKENEPNQKIHDVKRQMDPGIFLYEALDGFFLLISECLIWISRIYLRLWKVGFKKEKPIICDTGKYKVHGMVVDSNWEKVLILQKVIIFVHENSLKGVSFVQSAFLLELFDRLVKHAVDYEND